MEGLNIQTFHNQCPGTAVNNTILLDTTFEECDGNGLHRLAGKRHSQQTRYLLHVEILLLKLKACMYSFVQIVSNARLVIAFYPLTCPTTEDQLLVFRSCERRGHCTLLIILPSKRLFQKCIELFHIVYFVQNFIKKPTTCTYKAYTHMIFPPTYFYGRPLSLGNNT